MKRRSLLLLMIIPFLLSGCNNAGPAAPGSNPGESSSSQPQEEGHLKKDVVVKMDPMLRSVNTTTPYNLTFSYDDEYFLTSSKTYNKDLSMLSFGAAMATATNRRGANFYTDIRFKDIELYNYNVEPNENTMGYLIAHRSIDDYELVSVSFRGLNYGLEWANNFLIGKTGNHEGFNARGLEAYEDLQHYIEQYANTKTLKIWISGYSRAGALANVLASLIMGRNEMYVTQENLFVYTFEAPAALTEENAIAYENVHNITNEADLVASIPPRQYGLYRCGVDYQIYDANVSALAKEFDKDAIIPEFTAITDVTDEPMDTDRKVLDYILSKVFERERSESTPNVYANTREEYVDNYQAGLSACIGYIFGLKSSTRTELLNALKDLGFSAILIIGDSTGAALKDFIKPYLDKDHVAYDEDKLLADCAVLIQAIGYLFMEVVLMYASDTYSPNLTRLIDMHYTDTVYILLKNAHSKEASN